jgi:hypothetical protein
MVEKQALEGVLIPVCQQLDISFTANKGYSSSSAMHEAGRRIAFHVSRGKDVAIFYLGDHDPSGVDMTRDVTDRLRLFSYSDRITIDRLALNIGQVSILNPPENPAKETDSRAGAYIAQFGRSSWELDAIEPRQLSAIVSKAVRELRDDSLWNDAVQREQAMRDELQDFVRDYQESHE